MFGNVIEEVNQMCLADDISIDGSINKMPLPPLTATIPTSPRITLVLDGGGGGGGVGVRIRIG